MTPRAVAAIGLRLIALWILIEALFAVVMFVLAMLGDGHGPSVSNPIIAPSFDRTHTGMLAHMVPRRTVLSMVMRIVGGGLLWLFSKPIARLVIHNVNGAE